MLSTLEALTPSSQGTRHRLGGECSRVDSLAVRDRMTSNLFRQPRSPGLELKFRGACSPCRALSASRADPVV